MKEFRGNSTNRKHYKPLSKTERLKNHHIATDMNIRTRQILAKGEMNRSIIAEFSNGIVERSFHATKGLRTRQRVPA